MLHATMALLDNSVHMDNYVPWTVAWPGTYIASDEHSTPENRLATCEYILWAWILQTDHRYSPVHVATHACGDHAQMEDHNDSTHYTCAKNYEFT